MVVNDSGDLHEGVDRCRANTLEPPAHQVLAYRFSFRRLCRYLASIAEAVRDGLVVHKAPAVLSEWSEFLNHLQMSISKVQHNRYSHTEFREHMSCFMFDQIRWIWNHVHKKEAHVIFGPCKQGLGLLGFLCMDRWKWIQCCAGQLVFYAFGKWSEFLMLTDFWCLFPQLLTPK